MYILYAKPMQYLYIQKNGGTYVQNFMIHAMYSTLHKYNAQEWDTYIRMLCVCTCVCACACMCMLGKFNYWVYCYSVEEVGKQTLYQHRFRVTCTSCLVLKPHALMQCVSRVDTPRVPALNAPHSLEHLRVTQINVIILKNESVGVCTKTLMQMMWVHPSIPAAVHVGWHQKWDASMGQQRSTRSNQ